MELYLYQTRKEEGVYRMKINLPPIKKCKRMYKLLKQFYEEYKDSKYIENYTKFKHAMIIFCNYYHIELPIRIRFRRSFGKEKCLGMCYENGAIDLLYPYNYNGGYNKWISIVYHELAHYILWANAEEKAIEFELKMIKRR